MQMQTVDKFQRILDLMTRPGSSIAATSSSSGPRQVKIDPQAAGLLRDYIEEVAHSVVEEAAVLCRHRKGKHIGANDINLILGRCLLLFYNYNLCILFYFGRLFCFVYIFMFMFMYFSNK